LLTDLVKLLYHILWNKKTVLSLELFAMSFFFGKREAVGSGTERKGSAQRSIHINTPSSALPPEPLLYLVIPLPYHKTQKIPT
jgi:hypothetical protein